MPSGNSAIQDVQRLQRRTARADSVRRVYYNSTVCTYKCDINDDDRLVVGIRDVAE